MITPDPTRLVRISVFVEVATLDRLKDVAARLHVPVAQLIRSLLEKGLGGHRPQPRGGILS
ncbi:hypothetical protein BH09ACT5_BH09ACT5_15530 [soil metagenome]